MDVGDKIIYINNIAFMGKKDLLKRPMGIINTISDLYVRCKWILKDGRSFEWSVPIKNVKLLEENK